MPICLVPEWPSRSLSLRNRHIFRWKCWFSTGYRSMTFWHFGSLVVLTTFLSILWVGFGFQGDGLVPVRGVAQSEETSALACAPNPHTVRIPYRTTRHTLPSKRATWYQACLEKKTTGFVIGWSPQVIAYADHAFESCPRHPCGNGRYGTSLESIADACIVPFPEACPVTPCTSVFAILNRGTT